MPSNDYRYMARALRLAARGIYSAHPNPRVGCVLVNGGEVVGEGWHRAAGTPHAEVEALRAAGGRARGATAYVSLEPCCHHGRTPACTGALIEAGVARVVAAVEDPNPAVAGQGLAQLAAAGVTVESGVMASEAGRLNAGFMSRMRRGRPRLRIKLAATLDGRTASPSGESRWITGAAARDDGHRLRAESGAVITGSGTVRADDPALTVRLPGDWRQPLRVVLARGFTLSPEATMLTAPGDTLVYGSADASPPAVLEAAGATLVQMPADSTGLDLAAVTTDLGRRGINDALLEAGPTLAGAFVAAGLADELILYLAPDLLGDAGPGLFQLPTVRRLADRVALQVTDIRAVGHDWRVTALIDDRETLEH